MASRGARFSEDGMAAQATPDDNDPRDPADSTRSPSGASADWAGMASVGFEFIIAVLVPGALGWWLDGKFSSSPWIMLAGGLLGFVAGLRILMRSVSGGTKR
jgi:F0F1-type ATP synthase assembly protein I